MAVFLLLAGAAVWAFSTWVGDTFPAAEDEKLMGDSRYGDYPGQGELATALFDVQVGALLVFGCAVAVLLCRSVRGLRDVVAVLIALPCVLIVANAILAHVMGSSLTAAVIGGLVLVVVCVAFAGVARVASSRLMPTPQYPHESSAGRLLLLAFVMTAAGAVLTLDGREPAGWIVEAVPGLVSITVVQGALIAAMLALIAVMAIRPLPRRPAPADPAAHPLLSSCVGWQVVRALTRRGSGSPGLHFPQPPVRTRRAHGQRAGSLSTFPKFGVTLLRDGHRRQSLEQLLRLWILAHRLLAAFECSKIVVLHFGHEVVITPHRFRPYGRSRQSQSLRYDIALSPDVQDLLPALVVTHGEVVFVPVHEPLLSPPRIVARLHRGRGRSRLSMPE
jgi:hypothetical protein